MNWWSIFVLGDLGRSTHKGPSRVRAQLFVRAKVRQSPAQESIASGCALLGKCGVCAMGPWRMVALPMAYAQDCLVVFVVTAITVSLVMNTSHNHRVVSHVL